MCYDKCLVNVAAYVIPVCVCVCVRACVRVCVCACVRARGVNIRGHIYRDFITTAHYYIVFYH
jgi:hypothetical protein